MVVQDWPSAGTYWRSSWQMGHESGGSAETENLVPHVTQMWFSIATSLPNVLLPLMPLPFRRLPRESDRLPR